MEAGRTGDGGGRRGLLRWCAEVRPSSFQQHVLGQTQSPTLADQAYEESRDMMGRCAHSLTLLKRPPARASAPLNEVLVAFGERNKLGRRGMRSRLNDCHLLDVDNNTVTPLTPAPPHLARSHHAAAAFDEGVFFVGGSGGGTDSFFEKSGSCVFMRLDYSQCASEPVRTAPTPRPQSAIPSTRWFAGGSTGFDRTDEDDDASLNATPDSPTAAGRGGIVNTWEEVNCPPSIARRGHSFTPVEDRGKCVLLGGERKGRVLGDAYVFDAARVSFEPLNLRCRNAATSTTSPSSSIPADRLPYGRVFHSVSTLSNVGESAFSQTFPSEIPGVTGSNGRGVGYHHDCLVVVGGQCESGKLEVFLLDLRAGEWIQYPVGVNERLTSNTSPPNSNGGTPHGSKKPPSSFLFGHTVHAMPGAGGVQLLLYGGADLQYAKVSQIDFPNYYDAWVMEMRRGRCDILSAQRMHPQEATTTANGSSDLSHYDCRMYHSSVCLRDRHSHRRRRSADDHAGLAPPRVLVMGGWNPSARCTNENVRVVSLGTEYKEHSSPAQLQQQHKQPQEQQFPQQQQTTAKVTLRPRAIFVQRGAASPPSSKSMGVRSTSRGGGGRGATDQSPLSPSPSSSSSSSPSTPSSSSTSSNSTRTPVQRHQQHAPSRSDKRPDDGWDVRSAPAAQVHALRKVGRCLSASMEALPRAYESTVANAIANR
eukprot:TRINITY_DN756_c1_g1_i2.p1 TRINITY_DN756_c1_g1~~TRINITY_DN756_c1_g1_i2.p1  ORF type:complete len:704 (+),score=116.74 TRINITY_DN756_c1_g1_i2:129-2240(+)